MTDNENRLPKIIVQKLTQYHDIESARSSREREKVLDQCRNYQIIGKIIKPSKKILW